MDAIKTICGLIAARSRDAIETAGAAASERFDRLCARVEKYIFNLFGIKPAVKCRVPEEKTGCSGPDASRPKRAAVTKRQLKGGVKTTDDRISYEPAFEEHAGKMAQNDAAKTCCAQTKPIFTAALFGNECNTASPVVSYPLGGDKKDVDKINFALKTPGPAYACSVSPDGTAIAVLSKTKDEEAVLEIYNGETAKREREIKFDKNSRSVSSGIIRGGGVPIGCAVNDGALTTCVIFDDKIAFVSAGNGTAEEYKIYGMRFVAVAFSAAADGFVTCAVSTFGRASYSVEVRRARRYSSPVEIESGTLVQSAAPPSLFFSNGGAYMGIFRNGRASVFDMAGLKKLFEAGVAAERVSLCPYFTDETMLCFISAVRRPPRERAAGMWRDPAVEAFDPGEGETVSRTPLNLERFERFAALYRPERCAYIGSRDAMLCPSESGGLVMFDMATLEPLDEFRGHCVEAAAVRTVRGGANLVSCAGDETVRAWKVTPVKRSAPGAFDKRRSKFARPRAMYFTGAGTELVAICEDCVKKIKIDAATGALSESAVKCDGGDYCERQKFSIDGNIYVSKNGGKFSLLMKKRTGAVKLFDNPKASSYYKFSPDGSFFAACGGRDLLVTNVARAFGLQAAGNNSPRGFTAIGCFDLYALKIAGSRFALEFTDNGLLAVVKDRSALFIDAARLETAGKACFKMEGFHEAIAAGDSPDSVAYSVCGSRIAVKAAPRVIEIYDPAVADTPVAVNRFNEADATQFRLCGRGGYLLVRSGLPGSAFASLRLYRAGDNSPLYEYETFDGISDFAVNPDMSMMALYDGCGGLSVHRLMYKQ